MTCSPKCERAFQLITDSDFPNRIKECESSGEYGFALLLHFVQLEASVKVLKYWHSTSDGWPDTLKFLRANWTPLRDLKALDPLKYDIIIGVGGRSLREMRNRIAHEGHNLSGTDYSIQAAVSKWAIKELSARLPSRQDMRKKVDRVRRGTKRANPKGN